MYDEETEDKRLDPLVTLVLQNDAERVIAQIESGDFDPKVLEDVGCCDSPLPLYKLSVCSYIYLASPGWVKEVQPLIDQNLEGCRRLLDYWERMGYPVREPMDFESYAPYCARFRDCTFEDLFDVPMDRLIAMGYDRDEAEMCYAVFTYKPDLIEKQVQLRTDPRVYIDGELLPSEADESNGWCALEACWYSIDDAVMIDDIGSFWKRERGLSAYCSHVYALLKAAAYCEVDDKLREVIRYLNEKDKSLEQGFS